jgi:two-component system CheB/CheR fusion protein
MSHSIETMKVTTQNYDAMPLEDEGAALRILIADDQEVNRLTATIVLQSSGYSVDVAENGKEAVIKWDHGSFDLILMDINMPLINGIEATWIIRDHERDSGGYTPIIAYSADVSKGDPEVLSCHGFDGFLRKPSDLDTMLQEIERCIRLKRPRPLDKGPRDSGGVLD